MNPAVEMVARPAARHGLNLIGTVAVGRYDAAAPPDARASRIDPAARSIIVIGNGGGDFWRAYQRHLARNPSWKTRADPLDDFTREIVSKELVPEFERRGLRCVPAYPFAANAPVLRFLDLARLAGLGAPSLLGVLVHPRYGPWMALRAALLIDSDTDADCADQGEAAGFDPCPRCVSRACIAACPVGAVTSAGWDVYGCRDHRLQEASDCAAACHARRSCVLAPEARYPDDEIRYHQERALRTMRAHGDKRHPSPRDPSG